MSPEIHSDPPHRRIRAIVLAFGSLACSANYAYLLVSTTLRCESHAGA